MKAKQKKIKPTKQGRPAPRPPLPPQFVVDVFADDPPTVEGHIGTFFHHNLPNAQAERELWLGRGCKTANISRK